MKQMIANGMTDTEVIAKFKEENCWGLCTSIDLKDCDPAAIRDADKIHQFVLELADVIEMHRFGEPQIIHFGASDRVAGYSMTQLIETSLLSAHFVTKPTPHTSTSSAAKSIRQVLPQSSARNSSVQKT